MILAFAWGCHAGPPEPQRVAYDHSACDDCGMLVSDPRFAAQLVEGDGHRRTFDDPACLFRFVAANHPSIRGAWFRDATAPLGEDAWLPYDGVGFVVSDGAPMGGGFAAVPVGTAGAVSFGEASSRVLGGER